MIEYTARFEVPHDANIYVKGVARHFDDAVAAARQIAEAKYAKPVELMDMLTRVHYNKPT